MFQHNNCFEQRRTENTRITIFELHMVYVLIYNHSEFVVGKKHKIRALLDEMV
jgi:hypothetical protein